MTCRATCHYYLILLVSSICFADSDYRTKYTFDTKAIRTNHESSIGWVTGVRAARYLGDSQVNVGIAGYYGSPAGMFPVMDYVVYAGGFVEVERKISPLTFYELSLFGGFAQGRFGSKNPPITQKSYFTVEPVVAYGFYLGQGLRILGQLSYLHQNTNKDFSGVTFGLRFEYKVRTLNRSLND